jgi:hypothetical protein
MGDHSAWHSCPGLLPLQNNSLHSPKYWQLVYLQCPIALSDATVMRGYVRYVAAALAPPTAAAASAQADPVLGLEMGSWAQQLGVFQGKNWMAAERAVLGFDFQTDLLVGLVIDSRPDMAGSVVDPARSYEDRKYHAQKRPRHLLLMAVLSWTPSSSVERSALALEADE